MTIYQLVTNHAHKRMKERLGIKSPKERERRCQLAFQRGKPSDIEQTYWNGRSVNRIAIDYQGFLWIYGDGGVLITVYPKNNKGDNE